MAVGCCEFVCVDQNGAVKGVIKMPEYTDIYEMSSSLLVMEFKRLTKLEAKGETDKSVSYSADDLEDQISFRLNEYDLDR